MSKNFLTGNFLPAYGQSFGRIEGGKSERNDIPQDTLRMRFSQRAVRYRMRRGEYLRGLQMGIAFALLLAIGAFRLNVSTNSAADFTLAEQQVVQMEEIVQTLQMEKPPPPPKPPVPVEVPNDEILEDAELELDMSLDLDTVAELPPPPPPVAKEEEQAEPEIFMVVEEMPELVGGVASLLKEVKYPELARKAGLEGIVVVQIVIDENGKPGAPQVIKSVHKLLDDEAVRAVLKQTYQPGRQRGRPVKVAMNIPVTFRLN